MRHRVTILNHEKTHDNFIKHVNGTYLEISDLLSYTREDKYTLEFPNKFKNIKQLRISMGNIDSPVFNYNSVGLNIYAIPSISDKQLFFNEINPFIKNLFKVDVQDSNWILSKNALLLHLPDYDMNNMNKLLMELTHRPVKSEIVDFLYDKDKLVFSFINDDKSAIIKLDDPHIYEEIGIFLIDENSTPEDIILSGLRVVFDETSKDDPLHKTLFHLKPKFRSISTSNKLVKNGLHPKLKTTINSGVPEELDIQDCKLYYYMNLDKLVFIDKYNLGENFNFIANFGNSDLELPEYKIGEWGNEILLEVKDWSEDLYLNLHSRYQLPDQSHQSSKSIQINAPTVFFGCEDTSEKNVLHLNPFIHNFPIGNKYSQFFTNNTIFYQLIDNSKFNIEIPVPNKDFELIGLITSLTLAIGLIIILLQLINSKITPKKTQ